MGLDKEYIDKMQRKGLTLTSRTCCDSFIKEVPIFSIDGYKDAHITEHRCGKASLWGVYFITIRKEIDGRIASFRWAITREKIDSKEFNVKQLIDKEIKAQWKALKKKK